MPNFEVPPRHLSIDSNTQPPSAEKISEIAEMVREKLNATGLALGVVYNHEVIFEGGFGLADKETQKPVTSKTLFQIASDSKAFTSLIGVHAHELGKLPLDVPISKLIQQSGKGARFEMSDTAATLITTMRDMLSHRTGLPRHDNVVFGVKDRDEILQKLPYLQLDKPPRYQPAEYNNMMFVIAGIAEELALGSSWESLVETLIFEKLGMNMSFSTFSSALKSEFAANIATPYFYGNKTTHMNIDVSAPAGGIVSCVTDMVKWVQLHLRQSAAIAFPTLPPPAGPMIVGASAYTQILTASSLFPGMFSSFSDYSMGWWKVPFYEDAATGIIQTMFTHAGDLQGMSSNVMFFPALGHGLVVLTNEGSNSARDAITLEIADLLLGIKDPAVPWVDACATAQKKAIAATYARYDLIQKYAHEARESGQGPSLPLKEYTGKYVSFKESYGIAQIVSRVENGQEVLQVCGDRFLYTDYSGSSEEICGYMQSAWNETFSITPNNDIREIGASGPFVVFNVDSHHVVNFVSSLEPAVAPIVFTKEM